MRCSGASVAKVTVLSGTNRKPRPAPWIKPLPMIVVCDTSGVQPVMSYIAQAVSARPNASRRRVSTRPISRPTTNMAAIVPMPRGPMTRPAVTTG